MNRRDADSSIDHHTAAQDRLLAENDYLRVRMMVAISFLDSEALDRFHEHVAELDARHREISRSRPDLDPKVAADLFQSVKQVYPHA